MGDNRCRHCNGWLIDHLELEYGYCDRCLAALEDRAQERREWDHYHDDPCPEIELTPLPAPARED